MSSSSTERLPEEPCPLALVVGQHHGGATCISIAPMPTAGVLGLRAELSFLLAIIAFVFTVTSETNEAPVPVAITVTK